MSTDEKNGGGAENDIRIFVCESTHRPQMLETEEEICESEKAQKEKLHHHFIISTYILQVSPNSVTAVSHLAAGSFGKDASLPLQDLSSMLPWIQSVTLWSTKRAQFFLACICSHFGKLAALKVCQVGY